MCYILKFVFKFISKNLNKKLGQINEISIFRLINMLKNKN